MMQPMRLGFESGPQVGTNWAEFGTWSLAVATFIAAVVAVAIPISHRRQDRSERGAEIAERRAQSVSAWLDLYRENRRPSCSTRVQM